jgi:hypothetical protein
VGYYIVRKEERRNGRYYLAHALKNSACFAGGI